jgi:predicted nucleic acid-binding Zn ribbon protein
MKQEIRHCSECGEGLAEGYERFCSYRCREAQVADEVERAVGWRTTPQG